jgi:hypothetical protein
MPVTLPSGEGVRGPMLELIGYDRRYDRVAAYLLGDVVVVENLRSALDLWRRTHTDKTLVTLDGEVIDPHGVVTGGSRESALAGVLSQKREMRELEEVVARLEADYQAALDRHVRTKQALAEISNTVEELAMAARNNEMELLAQRKDGDRLLRERQQLEARHGQLRSSADDLRAALAQNEKRLSDATALLAELRESSLPTKPALQACAQRLRLYRSKPMCWREICHRTGWPRPRPAIAARRPVRISNAWRERQPITNAVAPNSKPKYPPTCSAPTRCALMPSNSVGRHLCCRPKRANAPAFTASARERWRNATELWHGERPTCGKPAPG